MKKMPLVDPNDDGIRPAGRPDECFYCRQKIGTRHLCDCVAVKKIIKARYSFELDIKVPHHWDADMFEFHRNESSWCADNAISELQAYHDQIDTDGGTCVYCSAFRAEFLKIVDDTPRNKVNIAVDSESGEGEKV